MDCPKKSKRWMTKDHIIDVARGLKDRCENNSLSALSGYKQNPDFFPTSRSLVFPW